MTRSTARYNLLQFDEAVTCFMKALEVGVPKGGEQVAQERLEMAKQAQELAAACKRAAAAARRWRAARPARRARIRYNERRR